MLNPLKKILIVELSIDSCIAFKPNLKINNSQKLKRQKLNARIAAQYRCFGCHEPYVDPPVED